MLSSINSYLRLLAPLCHSDFSAEFHTVRSSAFGSRYRKTWAPLQQAFGHSAWWLFVCWFSIRISAVTLKHVSESHDHSLNFSGCLAEKKCCKFSTGNTFNILLGLLMLSKSEDLRVCLEMRKKSDNSFWILSNASRAWKFSDVWKLQHQPFTQPRGGSQLVLICSDGSWSFIVSLPCQRKWGATAWVFSCVLAIPRCCDLNLPYSYFQHYSQCSARL